MKAYRALCDKCAIKKVEFRVPREQAIEMGIIDDGKQEEDDVSGKVPEEGEELANQVIVEENEEANEDEESKEEAAAAKTDTPTK